LGSADAISRNGGKAVFPVSPCGLLAIFQLREWQVIFKVSRVRVPVNTVRVSCIIISIIVVDRREFIIEAGAHKAIS